MTLAGCRGGEQARVELVPASTRLDSFDLQSQKAFTWTSIGGVETMFPC